MELAIVRHYCGAGIRQNIRAAARIGHREDELTDRPPSMSTTEGRIKLYYVEVVGNPEVTATVTFS